MQQPQGRGARRLTSATTPELRVDAPGRADRSLLRTNMLNIASEIPTDRVPSEAKEDTRRGKSTLKTRWRSLEQSPAMMVYEGF